jgi:hypothetical protein
LIGRVVLRLSKKHIQLAPYKPKLMCILLRDSIDEEVESFKRLFILLHTKQANQRVVCKLVYIKTTKPNIREISLTAVLGTVIVLEFG